jgi:hypothetical protein
MSKEDARIIACGLLHDGLDARKLSNKARDEIKAAIERLLALVPISVVSKNGAAE